MSVFLLFLEECILALVEVFEISVEHMRVLTNPFARLRNVGLKLFVLLHFHRVASWSQTYIFMHSFEEVALKPIGGILVETFLNR